MADLGSAYVNIVPKAPGISSQIEDIMNEGSPGAEKAGEGFGKKMLGAIGKLGIGTAVGNMVKQSFEAGGALQQSFGGLETIYGEAAEQAKAFAFAAQEAGISANEYAETAVGFGASLRAAYGGDTMAAMTAANTAILDMTDNAAKMGTPIESIQAAYQGFARGQYTLLDNLKLGYGGTKEEMERLLADAEAFSGVEYDIDNLGDVYEAIHVIQGELGLTGVAAGEAETTLSGSAAAMKASWENLMAALTTGERLEDAMSGFSKSVGSFATNVLGMLGELGGQLPDMILGLADIVIDQAPEFIGSGAEILIQLGVGLISKIPELVARVPEIFWALVDAFAEVDWASLGWDLINGIISGLLNAATHLYDAVRGIIRDALWSGRNEAQVGSPSKLFADELGHWIPPGVAEGVEENMDPLNRTMRSMMDGSLASAGSAGSFVPAAVSESDHGEILLQLLQALRDMKFEFYLDGQPITDNVTLRQNRALRSGRLA